MKRHLCLFLLTAAACALSAQTVIDLGPGGGVRARGANEHAATSEVRRTTADSLRWRDCLVRGFNALGADSLDRAESLFTEALRLFPDAQAAAVVRHNLGRIAMARGDYRRAIPFLTDALRSHTSLHQARMDRASCFLELGNTADALADVNTLIDHGATGLDEAELHFLRAAIRMKERLYVEARKDLEHVLRIRPDHEGAAILLALTDERDGRPQEALEHLNRLLQVRPESVDALAARANMESAAGQYEAARADCDAALRLRPEAAELYVQRAAVLLHLDLHVPARKDLDEAVRLGIPRAALLDLYRKLK